MISSISGRSAAPFLGPYSASKFALEGMSEALRRELMPFGIDVVIIAPGAVATPLWDKALELDVTPYSGTRYANALARLRDQAIVAGRNGFAPQVVGRAVRTALTTARPRARYTVTPNPVRHWLTTLLPKRIVDRIFARLIGLR